jgi:hypothetical protein
MGPTTKRTGSRADAATALFEELASKGHEPLLHHTTARSAST